MRDMNKHIFKTDDNKPFHSNGYAVVASGDRIGSTSSTSFNQRLNIDRNRRIVNNYHLSSLGGYQVLGSTPTPGIRAIERASLPLRQANQTTGRFNEPSSRKYNPYA